MPAVQVQMPPLHSGQQPVWDSEARFKVVCCGRRWGKTHMGVLNCLDAALSKSYGGHAWWIAPTYSVAGIGWSILKPLAELIPGTDISEGERRVTFSNGGWVQVKSGDRPDLLRGESLDCVVFDESADIKPESWHSSVRPALSDRKGRAMFIGTPRGQDNWFYDLWLRGGDPEYQKLGWANWQMPTLSNPFIDAGEVEGARLEMHPIEFAQEYLADFVMMGGTVFHPEWWHEAALVGEQMFHDRSEPAIIVLTERHGEEVTQVETTSLGKCIRFGVVDLALSTKASADFTVIGAWALTPQKRLVCLDVVRRRIESPDLLPNIDRLRRQWALAYVGVEAVAYQASVVQQGLRQGLPLRKLVPDKDKYTRALSAAPYMEGNRVWWRRGRSWSNDVRAEILAYPLSKHDDCVDMLSYAVTQIGRLQGRQLVSW